MIFTIYKIKPEQLKWRRWFAWYPVIIRADRNSQSYVWMQWVWRKLVVSTVTFKGNRLKYYEYRLEKPENEKEHSWDTYKRPPYSL